MFSLHLALYQFVNLLQKDLAIGHKVNRFLSFLEDEATFIESFLSSWRREVPAME